MVGSAKKLAAGLCSRSTTPQAGAGSTIPLRFDPGPPHALRATPRGSFCKGSALKARHAVGDPGPRMRFSERQLQHLLAPRRERDVTRGCRPALANNLLDLESHGLERDPEGLE